MNALEKWIIEDMIDRLDEVDGSEGYVCDLSLLLYEDDNYNGVITGYYSSSAVKEWIDKHWDDLNKEMEDYKFNTGEYLNPFEDAHAFMVRIVLNATGRLISESAWVCENWNEEVTYTEDIIKQIKAELQKAIED